MKTSDLLQWIQEAIDEGITTKDPEIEILISPTEKVRVLSVYPNTKNTKIFIDVELE